MTVFLPFPTKHVEYKNGHFKLNKAFNKMSTSNKVATVIATAVFSVLTLFLGTKWYVKTLVGRLRQIEIDENPPTGGNPPIKKTEKIAKTTLSNKSSVTLGNPAETSPGVKKSNNDLPKELQIEKIKKDFWQLHLTEDTRLGLPFQNALINLSSFKDAAEMIVDNYTQFRRNKEPDFLNDKALRLLFTENLMNEIQINLAFHDKEESTEKNQLIKSSELVNVIPVADNTGDVVIIINEKGERVPAPSPPRPITIQQLTTFNTRGDGSCGLHAMLGTPTNNTAYAVANIQLIRNTLCEKIRQAESDSPIHQILVPILKDYYASPRAAPAEFKRLANDKYEEYQKSTTIAIADKSTAFANDPAVLKAYLKNLENVSQYLLLEEIHIAALAFNIRVVIFQKLDEFLPDADPSLISVGYRVYNPHPILTNPNENPKSVSIWYNGLYHYERIQTSILV